ncbi:IS110 family transposase [Flammeovirga yaeyamensis]|uniref:IS110 family transposase n=1 Tax=Flammeovirga yaeyamensis TaxID=367791 RepID=A0AAX1N599_9BACT|nr:IS110 family transposase [Flammeovirga yaeyamensis]MBB3701556.1 transposase [Flammeovirga yaeyamensis]NMF38721.1 IS110 family transposase [Flammeovirga yaeyamensis]QWG02607.1 IS110 family transposase [Flammeovirga yaeyamensis]QWG04442.1 IS110 family transposase [Flammeovirga yaeyamensis]
MIYKKVIGVDVSKLTLDIALQLSPSKFIMRKCGNTKKHISTCFKTLFKEYDLSKEDVLIVAENTGLYTNPLIWSLVEEGYNLWIECPNQFHLSKGFTKGKNDQIDAQRLADYGYRNSDKAKLCELSSTSLSTLKYLNSERDLIVSEQQKFKAQITDHKDYVEESEYKDRVKRYNKILKALKENLDAIDKRIDQIVKNDKVLKHQLNLLKTIPGVGPKIALDVIIATLGFKKFDNARQFASYVGVAPFRYVSGTSIRSKNKVSKRSKLSLKSNIHMGVVSAIQIEGEFQTYYQRKISEGKNKMTAINNLRAKMIKRMFAVIKNNKAYQSNYIACWT